MSAPVAERPVLSGAAPAQRISWRVRASGELAACTLLRPGRRPALELRTATTRIVRDVPHLGPSSQLLLRDDGTVLLCHHRAGRHLVERLEPDGEIVPVAVSLAQGLALVDETHALEYDRAGFSRLVALTAAGPVEVAAFDGPAVGAVRLDAGRVAVDLMAGGHCSAVEVDTGTGAVEPFVCVSPRSDDHVLDYLPAANLLVVSTDATGEVRLGTGRPGRTPVTFPQALSGPGPATYLAAAQDGTRLAVSFEAGARSQLSIVDLVGGTARAVEVPPLVVLGRGALTATDLVVPVSTPDRPATLLRADLATGAIRLDDAPIHGLSRCRVERFAGVEAVVVGEPATAETVLVALHGGPLSAWRAMYDPLPATLAAAGIAVVAPNIRGSVGYGRAHALAIVDAWGGPDLADVLAVGAEVTGLRPPGARRPGLLGISYGAYLALLAAQRSPHAWSLCAALAPFVSGARLVGQGGPVADLVRRLGGATSPDLRDGLGATAAPVLLLHGEGDDVIPIAESALLHDALRSRAHPCTFRPLAGTGHDLLAGPLGAEVTASVVAFCHDSRHLGAG